MNTIKKIKNNILGIMMMDAFVIAFGFISFKSDYHLLPVTFTLIALSFGVFIVIDTINTIYVIRQEYNDGDIVEIDEEYFE